MERLIKFFKPEKYVLDLDIDKAKKTIGGKVTVSGEVLNEVVKFHAVDLKISDVVVNGKKYKFEADDEVLTVFDVDLGSAEIEIFYEGKLNENMQGAYLSTYEYEGGVETIVATQFESHYAREAFPCVDEPAAKAEFDVKITTPDKDDLILVNTPSPRMSTYLLAWVIGKFHGKTIKNAHGVEITTYCALNQDVDAVDFANEIAAKSLEFYDDNFGVPYPLKKLVQVALPDFEAGAMENWGLVTYRESMLLAGKAATLGTYKGVALTVAHELSHQWFGDLVTMEWWDDLWLNESFATIMEYYAVDYIHPEYKIFEGFFTGDCLAALRRDCLSGVQSVHQDVKDPEEIATLFDPAIVYAKGARLMLMLIRLMGWENFCKGVTEYFEKYQYKNTVGDNLWDALTPHTDFDTGKLMHAFIDKPGYPVVFDDGVGDFKKFSQKRFLLDSKMTKSDWPLPEILEDMSGHYILNLTDAEFEKELSDFESLGLEEKLRLLIDRDLVSKTTLAPSASLLPLVWKFREEKSAAVWNIILTIVSGLKIFFKYGSSEEKKYKKFVKELVEPGLEYTGLKTRKDDDENILRLRAILLALDFYAENQENLKSLANMYSRDYSKLDKEIRADILDAKLCLEPSFVDEYIEAYKTEVDPEIKFDLLVAMTLTKDEKALSKVMKLLDQPEVVKPQDQFHLFIYLYRNPVVKDLTFEWLETHWDYVKKISGDKSLDNYPRYMAGSVKTYEDYERYYGFFEPLSAMPALSRAVEMGKNEIAARLKLIDSDKKEVVEELEKMETAK
ncbi:M1 family metallopeptidase [Candidatus Saccharibacteria bacterium]|nr:M1 family metallopeptidase [Candidatus Saccharibacteria bacterium]